jgi:hypothetical protein
MRFRPRPHFARTDVNVLQVAWVVDRTFRGLRTHRNGVAAT